MAEITDELIGQATETFIRENRSALGWENLSEEQLAQLSEHTEINIRIAIIRSSDDPFGEIEAPDRRGHQRDDPRTEALWQEQLAIRTELMSNGVRFPNASRLGRFFDGGARTLPEVFHDVGIDFSHYSGFDSSEAAENALDALASVATASGEELKGQEATDYILNREQCVLSYLTKTILSKLSEKEILKFYNTPLNALHQKNIIKVNESPEEVAILVNRLKGKRILKDFFNLETANLSLLVPKIRLYKQLFTVNEEGAVVESKDADESLGEFEFHFNPYFRNEDITAITTSQEGRGHGVGIKSVDWSYEGTNPEEITTFIDFKLSLFLQNLSDLLPRGIEAVDRSVFYDRNSANLIQLIAAGAGGRSAAADNNTNHPLYFTVKAKLGWELDPAINTQLGQMRINDLKNIAEQTETLLELSLFEHNINFNQDGTLTLDLNYRAGIDEQLADDTMNILTVGLRDNQEAINDLIEEATGLPPDQTTDSATGNSPLDDELCNTARERLTVQRTDPAGSGATEEIQITALDRAALRSLRADADSPANIFNNYEMFFRLLLEAGVVWQVRIPKELISDSVRTGRARNIRESGRDEAAERQEQNEAREQRIRVMEEIITIQVLKNIQIDDVERIGLTTTLLDPDAVVSAGEAANEEGLDQSEPGSALNNIDLTANIVRNLKEELSEDGENYNIRFFRLGDMLDVIIEKLRERAKSEGRENILARENIEFLSGVLTFTDVEGERVGVNFTDILISVNKFREFFVENVVRPLKAVYNLKNFIMDMINKFSYVASTRGCIDDANPARDSRSSFVVFQSGIPSSAYSAGNTTVIPPGGLHVQQTFNPTEAQVQNPITYFVIQASDQLVSAVDQEGETLEHLDALRGIYHIKLGADRGLLKNISFSRDEIAGRREGRIVAAGGLSGEVLREKYDTDITLYGCPFIQPGMFIYVDPTMIGMGTPDGDPDSVSRLLGIGGYYFINKVSNTMNSDGSYETAIQASWNSYGCPGGVFDNLSDLSTSPEDLTSATAVEATDEDIVEQATPSTDDVRRTQIAEHEDYQPAGDSYERIRGAAPEWIQ